jgi:hypothetical protein
MWDVKDKLSERKRRCGQLIDRGGDALMLNECGGCVAGELKIESLIMGACVLPSQAFAGVWPTFVISLAGAVRKGLALETLAS